MNVRLYILTIILLLNFATVACQQKQIKEKAIIRKDNILLENNNEPAVKQLSAVKKYMIQHQTVIYNLYKFNSRNNNDFTNS